MTDGTATGHPVLAGVTVTCTCQAGAATTNAYGQLLFANIPPEDCSPSLSTNNGDVTQTFSQRRPLRAGNTTHEERGAHRGWLHHRPGDRFLDACGHRQCDCHVHLPDR